MHENGSYQLPHYWELHSRILIWMRMKWSQGLFQVYGWSSFQPQWITVRKLEYGIYGFVYTWYLTHTWLPLPNSRFSRWKQFFSAWLSPETLRPPTQQNSRQSCVLVTLMIDKAPMQKVSYAKSTPLRHKYVWPPNTASIVPICLSLADCSPTAPR